MARLFANLIAGQTSNNPLGQGDLTLEGAFLANLPVVSGSDFIKLILDPKGLNGAPEVVHVTAHAASATTATIARAQEGTTAREHPLGTRVVAGITAADLSGFASDISTLQTTTSTHTSQISTLTADLDVAEVDIDDLETAVGQLQSDVSALQGQVEGAVPTGTILAWAGTSAPTGFFLCDGSEKSRTTYADLFAVIGTNYGAGDGTNTFNVPNLQGKFPLGKAASGTGSVLGQTGGQLDHTHSIPSHTHSFAATSNSAGSHTHTNPTTGTAGLHDHGSPDILSAGDHTHTIGSSSHTAFSVQEGAGSFLNWRAYSSGTSSHSHSNGTAGAHIHSQSNGHRTTDEGSHSHSVGSTGSGGAHTHDVSGTTGSGGSGTSGSNNPPFQVVNYIIKY